MSCKCRSSASLMDAAPLEVVTMDAGHAESLLRSLHAARTGAHATAGPSGVGAATTLAQLHIVPTLDATLASTAEVSGHCVSILLAGRIGVIPYELNLRITLQERSVTLAAAMAKPWAVGPIEWTFDLGHAGLTLFPTALTIPATALPGVGCFARCIGESLAGVLLECLPSLPGGPSAFLACVARRAGGAAAKAAACIARDCI